MFDHYCTSCQRRSLVFPSQILSITNTEHGIDVAFTCWCGVDQTWTTGKTPGTTVPARTLVAA